MLFCEIEREISKIPRVCVFCAAPAFLFSVLALSSSFSIHVFRYPFSGEAVVLASCSGGGGGSDGDSKCLARPSCHGSRHQARWSGFAVWLCVGGD